MDIEDSSRLDPDIANCLREGGYRRDRIKRYWVGDSPVVSEMSRYYQEIGDDLARRERLSQACYDV